MEHIQNIEIIANNEINIFYELKISQLLDLLTLFILLTISIITITLEINEMLMKYWKQQYFLIKMKLFKASNQSIENITKIRNIAYTQKGNLFKKLAKDWKCFKH